MKRNPVELGDEVRDPVSGAKGIAIAVTSYLNGCDRVLLQCKQKDDKIPEFSFDEPQLEIIKRAKFKPKFDQYEKTGGPSFAYSRKPSLAKR